MITLLLLAAPLAIENVTVEVGDGTVLERSTVVIDNDRIISVGAAPPANATRIDGSGRRLTPGLVEIFGQTGLMEVQAEASANDTRANEPLAPAFEVARSFNPFSQWLGPARAHGVTSLVAAPEGGVLSGQGYLVTLEGTLASRPDPSRPTAQFGSLSARGQVGGTRGALWLALRQAIADARYYLANRTAADRGEARPLSLSPLHLEALAPVLAGTLPLVMEAHRASDIEVLLDWAKAERIRLVIRGGAEAWRVAERLAAEKILVVMQPSAQGPGSFDTLASRDDAPALLAKAGVPLVITSGGFDLRRLRQEAGIAVANGLSREAALKSITLAPMAAIGVTDRGLVKAGLRADLVLWTGDPLETTTHAERVWIGGVERSLDHRQARLVERYAPR